MLLLRYERPGPVNLGCFCVFKIALLRYTSILTTDIRYHKPAGLKMSVLFFFFLKSTAVSYRILDERK